jgi:hypothetical protein
MAVDEATIKELEDIESMFVQTAHSSESDGKTLTLSGLTPSTIYFSDRPKRIVGHLSSADFLSLWAEGENSFAEDPPNAVLAFLAEGDEAPEDAVVVIRDPRLENGSLSYSIEVLEGTVPSETGPVTLFIDPLGRPMSPGSVAGVHRRTRRRVRRRF